jgi:queuine tRNA-ribosyltransferase
MFSRCLLLKAKKLARLRGVRCYARPLPEPTLEEVIKKQGYPDPQLFSQINATATNSFRFEIIHQSKKSRARVGRIHTPHGTIETPGFVPVATTGTLKHVLPTEAESIGSELMFCNTYHLLIHPGPENVAKAGGLHKWINYNKPLITDSGGFQIFSMAVTTPQDELKGKAVKSYSSNLVKLREEGVVFRSYLNGDHIELTPEGSVQAQKDLGADIIIPLDILLPLASKERKFIESFHRTHRWEARSLQEHLKNVNNQAMYAVLHGGVNKHYRLLSLEYLSKLPFDGIAIGGSLGKDRKEMHEVLGYVSEHLPPGKPVHLLGIGDPESVESSVVYGLDTFDSCFPTRLGRHGTLFSDHGRVVFPKASSAAKHDEPPIKGCKCPTCSKYSGSYLNHLFKMHEPAAAVLGTIHNIHYMLNKMAELRERIKRDEI